MRSDGRFVVVYRWRIKPGRESDFARLWEAVTLAIRSGCESGGSALFRDEDGTYVGIARWPDRETREQCSAASPDDLEAMRDCVEQRYPEQHLDLMMDHWTTSP